MSQVRQRRLLADFNKLKEYTKLHPRVKILQTQGDPPEHFQLEYRINSLRMSDGDLTEIKNHLVEIHLPLNYPRTPPQCRMLTPVFHPNIAPHAICVGDHWSSGESLQSIVIRIGEMLAYQSYNIKSPLNGEAARWVEDNVDQVPTDTVSLLVMERKPIAKVVQSQAVVAAPTPSAIKPAVKTPEQPEVSNPSGSPETRSIACPHCEKKYRIPVHVTQGTVRCKNCQHDFNITAPA
ncbi:MAG: ubiquitin-conjugating enzyme E2 [Planctomycetaceae bacterium]